MVSLTVEQIDEQLRKLSPEKLAAVYDFVSYLAKRERTAALSDVMRAAESSLRKDWHRPEEDAAWAQL